MEAPEKIYLIRNFTTSTSLNTANDYRGKYLQEWYKSREKDTDVEYTRTDAFIEKACKWFEEHFEDIGLEWLRGYNASDVIEDFKKYMED